MSATISIDFNTKQMIKLERRFADVAEIAVPRAAKSALTKGKAKAKTEIWRSYKAVINTRRVKRSEVMARIKNLTTTSFPGNEVDKYEINMRMPSKGFGLIRFVKGPQKPRRQKGVKPISKRVKIKVEIFRGRQTTLDHSFIAKGRGGRKDGATNYQVFRRIGNKGGSRGKMVRTATPSVGFYVKKKFNVIVPPVGKKIQTSFQSSFRYFAQQELNRIYN